MAAKKTTTTDPANETREQRLARLRKVAATKKLTADFWPGNASTRKAGDELVGVVRDIRETKHRKYRSPELEDVTVMTVQREDGAVVDVQLNASMRRQVTALGIGIGDEVLVLYRGLQPMKSGQGNVNEFGIELVTRAGDA